MKSLLDDPRFWCLLYEPWLQPEAGDPFADGEDYFFATSRSAIDDLFRELEASAVEVPRRRTMPPSAEETYLVTFPVVSVLVDQPNGWRAGVDLVMCPGDFGFDYVIVPPSGEHLLIGVHGGNSWLPALRWEEVVSLGGAAKALLLFYPASYPVLPDPEEARRVLRRAWEEVGFPVHHLDEWVQRTTDHGGSSDAWRPHPTYGWVCDGGHSLRHPMWLGKLGQVLPEMLEAVPRLFASL